MPLKSRCFLIFATALLSACGGGGGGGDSSSSQPRGSAAIAEVDSDHDGLIEISNLQQLDWIRNNPNGTSLIDTDRQANTKGCPTAGCTGYELVADLNFDTNGDGIINSSDTYFDYEKNGTNAGWLPIQRFSATFEGNNHHIRNLYVNRPSDANNYSAGLFALIVINTNTISKIQNIAFDGPLTSVTGRLFAGTLAGEIENSGNLIISHISQVGRVRATGANSSGGMISSTWFAGGIAGSVNNDGTLTVDSNSATSIVESTNSKAGGLFAYVASMSNSAPLIFSNNVASSEVTGKSAGGMLETLWVATTNSSVTNNSTSGSVTGNQVGGLISSAVIRNAATFRKNHSSTSASGSGSSGGLIGELTCDNGTYIEESYATGNVTGQTFFINVSGSPVMSGSSTGGIIGRVSDFGTCGIKRSFSTGDISGGYVGGGIVGQIFNAASTGQFELADNFSSGSISSYWSTGGIVGSLSFINGSLNATRNYALGHLTSDPAAPGVNGGIAGNIYFTSPSSISLTFNHWASDTTGTSNAYGSTSMPLTQTGNLGALRLALECPITANNLSCSSGELYHSWNNSLNSQSQPSWNFGSTAQLPALYIDGILYRPSFNGNGYSITTENL